METSTLGKLVAERKGWYIYQTTDPNLLKTGCTHFVKENRSDERYETFSSQHEAEQAIDDFELAVSMMPGDDSLEP